MSKESEKRARKLPRTLSRISEREDAQPELHPLLEMQRTVGNRAVLHFLSESTLQRQNTVDQPGDSMEGKAEQVAAPEVFTPTPDPSVQRKAKSSSVLSSTVPHIQRASRSGESTSANKPDVAAEPDAAATGAGALIV